MTRGDLGKDERPRVRCKTTGASSAKFGPCEVCHEHVGEVWSGTPDNGVNHVFGHKSCVEQAIGLGGNQ